VPAATALAANVVLNLLLNRVFARELGRVLRPVRGSLVRAKAQG